MATIPDKVNIGALATVVAVGAISMIGISAALTAMVRAEQDAHELEKGTTANLRLKRELSDTQNNELTKPAHWVDPAHGKVAIPIDSAMQLVVRDISKNPNAATEPAPRDAGTAAVSPTEGADAGAAMEGDAGAPAAEGADPESTKGAEPATQGSEPPPAPAPENEQGEPTPPAPTDPAPKGQSPKAPKAPKAPEPQPPAPDPGSP